MARLPRLDLPGIPQHIVQCGNDRQPCFADATDYMHYRQELREAARKHSSAEAWTSDPEAARDQRREDDPDPEVSVNDGPRQISAASAPRCPGRQVNLTRYPPGAIAGCRHTPTGGLLTVRESI